MFFSVPCKAAKRRAFSAPERFGGGVEERDEVEVADQGVQRGCAAGDDLGQARRIHS